MTEQERPDVATARLLWKSLQPRLDPRPLDETGTATNMAPGAGPRAAVRG